MTVNFTSPYTQNFDTLANTGTNPIAWANDTTITGWNLFTGAGAAITNYQFGTGSLSTGTYWSYGSTSATDRALGASASGGAYFGSPAAGAAAGYLAVGLTNNGAGKSDFTISYTGEQWRNGGNVTPQSLLLEYGYGATYAGVTTWTAAGATFDFTSPIASATAAALDGNLAANRVTGLGGTVTSAWGTGSTLWVRWRDLNDAGNDHGLSVDDFSISATDASNPIPNAPSALSATAISSSQIDLTWTDNSNNETGFIIERATDSGFTTNLSIIATPAADATSYSDSTGLNSSTTYYYRIRATNGGSDSTNSAPANATTLAGIPGAPSSLVATTNTTTSINLTWADNSGNEDGFTVETTAFSNSPTAPVVYSSPTSVVLAANTTSYTVTGLQPGVKYYFRVKANNSTFGDSPYSNIASAGTAAATATTIPFNGTTYIQNFDHLTSTNNDNTGTVFLGTGTSVGAFATGVAGVHDLVSSTFFGDQNAALNGWSFDRTSGTDTAPRFAATTQSLLSGATYSYGADSDSDRALGLLASGSNTGRIGAVFENTSGSTITSVKIDFTSETWRLGSPTAGAETLFTYSLNAANISDAGVGVTFTAVTALDLTSTGTVTPGATNPVDGNNVSNQTAKSATISVNWLPGTKLVIRWTDADNTGSDHGTAVDNFSLSVPVTLPAWLNPSSVATWDDANNILNVTGNAEIIADPAASGDNPIINGLSSLAVLSINPTVDNLIHIDQLNFTGGASASVTSHPVVTRDATLIALNGLNLGPANAPVGKLDLGNNNLAVNYGANPTVLSTINSYVLNGLTLLGGSGTAGIASAEVDAQTLGGTVLAVVDDGDVNIGGGVTSLSGQNIPAPATSVLVKYTWFGDATLDGVVDGSDYALTDTGFTSGGANTGWLFGDYTFDGLIDGSDYALQDTGFIGQTSVL